MNYYRRYVGDFIRDTAHLSMAEVGAYTMLLDHIYATEKCLPSDIELTYRICRAVSQEERKNVDSVINLFFIKHKCGLINRRASMEIKLKQSIDCISRKNGKKGGRPRNPEITQRVPKNNPEITQKKPDPNHQPPTTNRREEKVVRATPFLAGFELDADMILFANGRGVDPAEEFSAFSDHHRSRGSVFKDWKAAWRNWVRNAVKFGKAGGPNGTSQPKSFDAIRREEGDAATRRILDRYRDSVGDAREALPALPGRAGKADLH